MTIWWLSFRLLSAYKILSLQTSHHKYTISILSTHYAPIPPIISPILTLPPLQCDPEASLSILTSPILTPKTTLVPLDLTHRVLATPPIRSRILHGPRPSSPSPSSKSLPHRSTETPSPTSVEPLILRPLLHDLLTFFASTYDNVFNMDAGPPLHDPLAVAVVLDDIGVEEMGFEGLEIGSGSVKEVGKRIKEEERFSLEVDVSHGEHVGRTRIKMTEDSVAGVRVLGKVDVARFWDVVDECIVRAEEGLRAMADPP